MTPADQCPEDVRKAVGRIWGLAIEVLLLAGTPEAEKTHATFAKLNEELRAAGFMPAQVKFAERT